jgi:hypothetical protein
MNSEYIFQHGGSYVSTLFMLHFFRHIHIQYLVWNIEYLLLLFLYNLLKYHISYDFEVFWTHILSLVKICVNSEQSVREVRVVKGECISYSLPEG